MFCSSRSCARKHNSQIFLKNSVTEKYASIFLGSRTVSLSRSSGETLAVHSTASYLIKKMREAKTALKSGSSPLALSSFPKLLDRLCVLRKGSRENITLILPGAKKYASIFLGSRIVSLSRSNGEMLVEHSTEALKKTPRFFLGTGVFFVCGLESAIIFFEYCPREPSDVFRIRCSSRRKVSH